MEVVNEVIELIEEALTKAGASVSEGSEGEMSVSFKGYGLSIEVSDATPIE